MNLSNLVHELSLVGSFSYNVNTGESNPSNGYMVSLPECEKEFCFDKFDSRDLKHYYFTYSEIFADQKVFFVGNFDGDKVCLNANINIQNLEDAIYLGMSNRKKVIFDCSNNRKISLPPPQVSGTNFQNRTYNELKARQLAYLIQTTGLE